MDETAPTAPPTSADPPVQLAPNLLHVDPMQAQANADKMVKEMADLRASVEQLKAKIEELEANVKKVDDKIDRLDGELSELNGERRVLKDKENKLESLKSIPRDQWNAEDREKYRDRADLDASFANVIADKASLNSDKAALNQRILNLDNEKASLREEKKSSETKLEDFLAKLNQLKVEYEAATGASVDSGHGVGSVIFSCGGNNKVTEHDLERNLIGMCAENCTDPRIAEFKQILATKRKFILDDATNQMITTLQAIWSTNEQRNDERPWSLSDNIEVVVDPTASQNPTGFLEILQYVLIAGLRSMVLPPNLSENALDVVQTGPVLDFSCLPNMEEYNRNKKSLFPLNFRSPDEEEFHTYTKADFSVPYRDVFYRIISVSKNALKVQNALFESDLVKTLFVANINLVAIHRVTGNHAMVCPFIIFTAGCYELYIMFKENVKESPRYLYKLVNTYKSTSFREKTELAFHIRNILDMKLPDLINPEDAKILVLKRPLGSSLSASRSKGSSTSATESIVKKKKPNEFSKSAHSTSDEMLEDEATLKSYKLMNFNPAFAPDLPNCRFAMHRFTGLHVFIKRSHKEQEIYFLKLLNSPFYRADPRNVTIQVIEIVQSPKVYRIVFPLLAVLLDTFGETPNLSKELWLRLVQQLCDYCDFLHEHRICHRDIKPNNLAVDLDKEQLVVFDCDLMEVYPEDKIAVVTKFCGTEDWSDPEYVRNPERGFNVFELERYSVEKTCEWMIHQAKCA
ncbi:hypothetical protein HDU79_009524 [Rhizoclosmatium sp. JEL0117]|nr:hypothetical protein HDU79_009524 [Rhizoclosmatium sp. JEL0117]